MSEEKRNMGDAEVPEKAQATPTSMGFSPKYLLSIPGLLRIINVVLGAVSVGLWIPGYEHEFLGEKINQMTGDTSRGYGNGFKRETLNQFVLAAIIIALGISVILLFGLVFIKQASVDWNRFNKLAHLALGLFVLIAAICSVFGVWYFQENCCHIDMSWKGLFGVQFRIDSAEGYVRHCYCYLTKYIGQSYQEVITDTSLYDSRNPDTNGFDSRWVWEAHHIYPHVAAIFVIFVNSIVYLLAFIFSKTKST